ncbi:MAG: ABC transporter permease subunit [Dehalococcoidales bacterium]|nr:ABC transporter permease subunit [Dehalococcoidales bacterium]
MKSLLTISKWELTRLRLSFSGRSRFVVLAIVLLAIVTSFIVYHQGLTTGKELYSIGVSFNGPVILDQRFHIMRLDTDRGHTMLNQGTIDAYIDENGISARGDERSQYVKAALLRYLSKQELLRLAQQYESDLAFPLRIEVVSLEGPENNLIIPGEPSPPQIPDSEESPPTGDSAPNSSGPSEPTQPESDIIDAAVKQQLEAFENGGLSTLKEALTSEKNIIIPSLTPPPMPLAQVILVFSFVVPVLFVAVFFASSFAEERVSQRLVVLLSTPVSPLQIILGKMLPYMVYSWIVITVITLMMGGNVTLSLAIFTPVALLIFSAYMVVALMYRTFKDLTLFSVLVVSVIMAYLVIPALLAGVSSLSYISPLTLALKMYRDEAIALPEYLLSTLPLYLIFFQAMFIGTRIFNEEYLTGFKPLHVKIADAMNLAIDRNHLNLSAFLSDFFLLPAVFIIQLTSIIFLHGIPMPYSLWILVIASAVVEELTKSAVVLVLLRNRVIKSGPAVVRLSALSALGFFSGEKLLLLLTLAVLSRSAFISAVFGGGLWVMPLVLHVVSTSIVGLLTQRLGTRYYLLAVAIGSIIHAAYNLYFIGVF